MQQLRIYAANNTTKVVSITLFVAIIVSVVALGSVFLPMGIDWHNVFRPAALNVLAGKSPFDVQGFYAAPWAILPLLPIAVLPENVSRAVLFMLGLASFGYSAYRLGAKPVAMIAFLLSPPVLHCLLNSNIDWLPL